MRMNYHRRNKGTGKRGVMLSILIALILAVGGMQFFFPSFLPSLAHSTGALVWGAETEMEGVTSTVNSLFMSKQDLIEENKRLKQELIHSRINHLSYDILSHELEELREQLGRVEEEDVLVSVIARPPRIPYDTFVIDAGAQEGLKVGDVARVGDRVAIGQVVEVYERTAKITLFSSPRNQMEVRLIPSDLVVSILGQGGGGFFFELSREETVEEDDLLVLPGISQMLVAEVVSVETPESGAFHHVFARLSVDLSNVSTLIITPRGVIESTEDEQ